MNRLAKILGFVGFAVLFALALAVAVGCSVDVLEKEDGGGMTSGDDVPDDGLAGTDAGNVGDDDCPPAGGDDDITPNDDVTEDGGGDSDDDVEDGGQDGGWITGEVWLGDQCVEGQYF